MSELYGCNESNFKEQYDAIIKEGGTFGDEEEEPMDAE